MKNACVGIDSMKCLGKLYLRKNVSSWELKHWLTAVPDSAEPDSAVPDSAVPDSAVPDSAVPDSAEPLQIVNIFVNSQSLLSGQM